MPTSRHLHSDGHRLDHGMPRRDARLHAGGSATAPAVFLDRLRFAGGDRHARRRDGQNRRPAASELLTKAALRNASVVLRAHLRLDQRDRASRRHRRPRRSSYDLEELDRVGREVPVLLDLKPAGQHFMEDFHAAGGVPALWRRLKDHLDLNARTVNGETIRDVVARWPAYVDDNIIRPLGQPLVKNEAIAFLTGQPRAAGRGDQARGGHAGAVPARGRGGGVRLARRSWRRGSDDPELNVTPRPVMVLRNAGPIGAPGMPRPARCRSRKKLGPKDRKDMVRISDARMSGTAFGTVVLHVRPEAAAGGPLALVRDGTDMIRLDAGAASSTSKSTTPRLARRKWQWKPPAKPDARLPARLYARARHPGGTGLRFRFPRASATRADRHKTGLCYGAGEGAARSPARGLPDETPQIHYTSWRCRRLAAAGSRTATGDPGHRVSS